MIWLMSSARGIYDRIMGKNTAKQPKLGFMIGHEPPARNPGPPDFEIQAAAEGNPIPYIEEYEDGSAKLIHGAESEWVKRPDEGEKMSLDNSNIPVPPELPHHKAASAFVTLEALGYAYYGGEKWRAPRPRREDFEVSDPMKSRWQDPPNYGKPDLECSAIGDKSEPRPWDGPSHKVVFINIEKQVPIGVIDGLKKNLDDQLSKLGVKAILLGPGLKVDSPSDGKIDALVEKVSGVEAKIDQVLAHLSAKTSVSYSFDCVPSRRTDNQHIASSIRAILSNKGRDK